MSGGIDTRPASICPMRGCVRNGECQHAVCFVDKSINTERLAALFAEASLHAALTSPEIAKEGV